jgi:hypothetical protein
LLSCYISLNAQQEEKDKRKSHNDQFGFERDYFRKGKPSIDISYGFANAKLKDSEIDFERNGIIDLKLGYKYIAQHRKATL